MSRLRLATQVQSYVTSFVRANPNETYPLHVLTNKVQANYPNAAPHHVMAAVTSLLKANILQRVRAGSGKSTYRYQLHSCWRPNESSPTPAPEVTVFKAVEETSPVDVSVSVDKASGGLVVCFKGIRLTINVGE